MIQRRPLKYPNLGKDMHRMLERAGINGERPDPRFPADLGGQCHTSGIPSRMSRPAGAG